MQAGAVRVDLEDLPAKVGVRHGKQQPIGVEMQPHVSHETAAVGPVERGQLAVGPDRRKHGDFVGVAVRSETRVPLVVVRQSEFVRASLDEQKPVEIQERVREQCLLAQLLEVSRALQRREPLTKLRAARIAFLEGVAQIVDGQRERLTLGFRTRHRRGGAGIAQVAEQVGQEPLEVVPVTARGVVIER